MKRFIGNMSGKSVIPLMLLAVLAVESVQIDDLQAASEDIWGYAQYSAIVNFDNFAQQYVSRVATQAGRRVSWWDLYGKHQHLRERPQYHRYQINIRHGDFKYSKATAQATRPKVVQSKTFNNDASQPISSRISWESRQLTSAKWVISQGVRAEWEVEIDSKIPIIESQPKNKTTVSLSTTREQSYSEQETFSISYSVTVPPRTQLKATWLITEREMEVPFTVDVYIRGYVAIWFSEKYDGHWLWFHPVAGMANDVFRYYDGGLVYTVKGIYRGIRGIDSNIETQEKSLEPAAFSEVLHGDE